MDQKEEDASKDVEHVIPFREQLRKALTSKQTLGYRCSLGTVLDIIDSMFNIFVACLYIASTYRPHDLAVPLLADGHWYPILLLLAHIFFLLEYLLRIYVAEDFRKYMMSFESIISIVTSLPYFAVTFTSVDPYSDWRFFVRMLDLLRIYVLFRLCYYIENDLPRELTKIIIGGKT
jgi:hypothetical protein